MNNQIEVGSLVYCYRRERYFGRCNGVKTVTEIKIQNEITFYRVEQLEEAWYTNDQLVLAQRPPEGIETKFKIGDRVHCFSTNNVCFATVFIENIEWFEGKPSYYITPTETPWHAHSEDSLQLANKLVCPVPEWGDLIF